MKYLADKPFGQALADKPFGQALADKPFGQALTIMQPYASLIAAGKKRFETRSWSIKPETKLAVHAGKRFIDGVLPDDTGETKFPFGGIIATCKIKGVYQVTHLTDFSAELQLVSGTPAIRKYESVKYDEPEFRYGEFHRGWYAWLLSNITPLAQPIPCRGQQGLWNIPPEIECLL